MFQPDLYWVRDLAPYRLALMPRPRGGDWLDDEVAGWRRESIDVVVSLLESHEVRELQLQKQAAACEQNGIEFLSFPIVDRGVPASHAGLVPLVTSLHSHLLQGHAVAIHCRAGIGRTGLVAGCLLHLLGTPGQEIFPLLSRSRGVAMPDTDAQAEWAAQFCLSQKAL
jgi:protein-tyrosine phosphatase